MLKTCGKQARLHLSSGFGSIARAGTSSAPVAPRGPSGLSGPRTAAMSQRGIVSDWLVWGKRKVREASYQRSHPMHNFSTSTIFVQRTPRTQNFTRIWWKFSCATLQIALF